MSQAKLIRHPKIGGAGRRHGEHTGRGGRRDPPGAVRARARADARAARPETRGWRASRWTGGVASVALILLILGGLASSREGGAARGGGWRPHDPRPADVRPVVDPRSTLTVDGPDRPVAVGAAEEMAHVEAVDAETERWSVLLPAVSADHRVFGKPRGNGKLAGPDQRLGFACHRRAIPRALDEQLSIVGFEPVTTRPEATHHITAFGCDAGAESLPETFFGATCAVWAFAVNDKEDDVRGGKKAPCRVMIYAYDKGASGFRTPRERR